MTQIFIKLQWLLVTAYIVSIIVFKMHYTIVSHVLGILMIGNLVLLMLLHSHQKYRYNSVVLIYFIFSMLALFSSLWSIDFDNTSFRAVQILVLSLYMFVIYNSFVIFKMQNTFLNAILIGSLINYLLLLGIVPTPFPVITEWGNRAFGTVGNPNVLAFVMLLSILVSSMYIEMRDKINTIFYYYQYLNIVLALYIILLTASKKGAIFGAILFFIFLFQTVKDPKLFFKFVVGVILGIFILSYIINIDNVTGAFENTLRRFMSFGSQISSESTSGSTGERKYFIELGLVLFQNNPIWGYGLDTFRYLNDKGIYAHNNYIELLVDLGMVGLVLFYYIYFSLMRKIFNMYDKKIRNFLFAFILILLFMEMAYVSYGLKLVLITLLAISSFAEKNDKKLFRRIDGK